MEDENEEEIVQHSGGVLVSITFWSFAELELFNAQLLGMSKGLVQFDLVYFCF
jgi:hypothetical protein